MSITYYEQLLNIVAPELTDGQYKSFKSDFAQIKTRGDYIKITDNLKEIGKQKGKSLPDSPSFIF